MRERETSWGKVAGWYGKKVGKTGHYYHESTLLPRIISFISTHRNPTVLDLGCGQGVLERTLAGKIQKYVGVDIAPELISQAKRLSKSPTSRYLVGDVSKSIQGLDEKFDIVTCVLALQNIEDFQGVFQNVGKYTKTGGSVLIVLNHPYFRIPRASGWEILPGSGKQIRWVSAYLREQKIPITMNPSERNRRRQKVTWSFHVPLSTYITKLSDLGFALTHLEEIASPKESAGKFAERENTAREEIPLFMILIAKKLT